MSPIHQYCNAVLTLAVLGCSSQSTTDKKSTPNAQSSETDTTSSTATAVDTDGKTATDTATSVEKECTMETDTTPVVGVGSFTGQTTTLYKFSGKSAYAVATTVTSGGTIYKSTKFYITDVPVPADSDLLKKITSAECVPCESNDPQCATEPYPQPVSSNLYATFSVDDANHLDVNGDPEVSVDTDVNGFPKADLVTVDGVPANYGKAQVGWDVVRADFQGTITFTKRPQAAGEEFEAKWDLKNQGPRFNYKATVKGKVYDGGTYSPPTCASGQKLSFTRE